MRSVFSRSRRAAAACLLIVFLLAPSAFATDTSEVSFWDEFVAWLAGRIDIPNGATAADADGFMMWLMGRIGVPNG
jgi:hypothetical protein